MLRSRLQGDHGSAVSGLRHLKANQVAYRRSLLLDPADIRAKWNLELALKKKKGTASSRITSATSR